MVKELGHFIAGKRVAGKSGRFGDVYNPNTGEVQARIALASRDEVAAAVADAAAAQPQWAARNPQVRARVFLSSWRCSTATRKSLHPALERARQDHPRFAGRHSARPRGLRIRHRHPASPQGRVHRGRRSRHRHVLHAPAARCRGRYHPVQFPGDDPDVEIRPCHRLRQCIHPEAVRARPFRSAAPCRSS